jgi:iron complex transport system substrate-binding protein
MKFGGPSTIGTMACRAPRKRTARCIGALVLWAALVACGDGTDPPAPAAAPSATAAPAPSSSDSTAGYGGVGLPAVVRDATGLEVTVRSIERIIPLDGDLAEIVFALGLGANVVATDLSATYPPEADARPEIGYQRALTPEPIATMEPTVLLGTELAGPPEVLDSLRSLGIPVVIVPDPPDASGPATKIRAVGEALGVGRAADRLAASVQAAIDDASAAATMAAQRDGRPRVMALYLRGERVQILFGKGSGIDWVIDAAGGIDVGTELGVQESAPITAEALLAAAPDVIMATTTGLESVGGIDGLLAIGGLARTPAGQGRAVVAFEDQYLLGGGPRTADLVRELTAVLHPAPTTDTTSPGG